MYKDFKNNYLFLIPMLGMCLSGFLFFAGGENTVHLWDEGHLVEIITELGFLFGFFSFLYLGLYTKGAATKCWMFFWSALSLLFFGEESSWMQHFLLYDVPQNISDMNAQGELNLHNLKFLQSTSIHSDGGLSLANLLSAQNLFRLGFLGYFLVCPVICRANFFKSYAERLSIPLPGLKIIILIWVPIIFTVLLSILTLDDPITKRAVAESREMFYGIGIGMFALVQLLHFEKEKFMHPH